MSKINSLFAAVAVAGVMMISADCLAQGCNGCGQATTVNGTLSYPANGEVYSSVVDGYETRGGRFGHGQGDRISAFKAEYAHAVVNANKVIKRNEAWPMPFDCASRQLYFSIWEPMIDQGFEEQCVLTSSHFDPETNELNSFGNHTVAGIMQNMPTARRKVFVHREADVQANNARIAAVKKTIDTFYGHQGPANVAFSTKLPVTLRGTKAEAISRLGFENQPLPVIPISAGSESVGASVGN